MLSSGQPTPLHPTSLSVQVLPVKDSGTFDFLEESKPAVILAIAEVGSYVTFPHSNCNLAVVDYTQDTNYDLNTTMFIKIIRCFNSEIYYFLFSWFSTINVLTRKASLMAIRS